MSFSLAIIRHFIAGNDVQSDGSVTILLTMRSTEKLFEKKSDDERAID